MQPGVAAEVLPAAAASAAAAAGVGLFPRSPFLFLASPSCLAIADWSGIRVWNLASHTIVLDLPLGAIRWAVGRSSCHPALASHTCTTNDAAAATQPGPMLLPNPAASPRCCSPRPCWRLWARASSRT